jgi:hypothetical protein
MILLHTQEVTGSSPVAPTIIHSLANARRTTAGFFAMTVR